MKLSSAAEESDAETDRMCDQLHEVLDGLSAVDALSVLAQFAAEVLLSVARTPDEFAEISEIVATAVSYAAAVEFQRVH